MSLWLLRCILPLDDGKSHAVDVQLNHPWDGIAPTLCALAEFVRFCEQTQPGEVVELYTPDKALWGRHVAPRRRR